MKNVEWVKPWNQKCFKAINRDLQNGLDDGNTWATFVMYSSRLDITIPVLIMFN